MNSQSTDGPEFLTANVNLSISGRELRLEMTVPTGATRPVRMLPLFQSLADAFVEVEIKTAERSGKQVSCKKGCGACCRQLVPITKAEAYWLRDLVNEMPEERRSEILARFKEARLRLEDSGLLSRLAGMNGLNSEQKIALGLDYFRQGIACPFLEDESCSIHPQRPVVCREYVVTSPAENCSNPTPEGVRLIKVAAKVSQALAGLVEEGGEKSPPWVPLILALEWAEANPDESRERAGTELVQALFSRLTGKEIPADAT
jgi:Fe-S-cluster containining protein